MKLVEGGEVAGGDDKIEQVFFNLWIWNFKMPLLPC